MLLQHAWLAPLVKPSAIMEEDEDESEGGASSATTPATETPGSNDSYPSLPHDVVDAEVATWVIQAMEKRRQGKLGKSEKPALHAAPLDAVPCPVKTEVTSPQ
jgi:mitogen-activated protein kinase kinase